MKLWSTVNNNEISETKIKRKKTKPPLLSINASILVHVRKIYINLNVNI